MREEWSLRSRHWIFQGPKYPPSLTRTTQVPLAFPAHPLRSILHPRARQIPG